MTVVDPIDLMTRGEMEERLAELRARRTPTLEEQMEALILVRRLSRPIVDVSGGDRNG